MLLLHARQQRVRRRVHDCKVQVRQRTLHGLSNHLTDSSYVLADVGAVDRVAVDSPGDELAQRASRNDLAVVEPIRRALDEPALCLSV